MAIFKKISPLEGNPMKSDGVSIEFKGMYYETEDKEEIEFISGFKQYVQVESKEETQETPKQEAKAATGTISAASLAKMAAANK